MHPDLVRISAAAELDRQLVALKRDKAKQEQALADAREAASTAEATLESLRTQNSENEARQHELRRSIEKYEARRASAERVLSSGGGDPEAAERQVEGTTQQLDRLETELLECMETADQLTSELTTAEATVERTSAELEAIEQRHDPTITRLRNAFNEILPLRDAELAELDRETKAKYLGLRDRKGSAVADIQRNACKSCRMVVHQQHLADLKRGLIIPCRGCGRWLVPDEPADEELG